MLVQVSKKAGSEARLALMAAVWKSRKSLQRGMHGCRTTDDLSGMQGKIDKGMRKPEQTAHTSCAAGKQGGRLRGQAGARGSCLEVVREPAEGHKGLLRL